MLGDLRRDVRPPPPSWLHGLRLARTRIALWVVVGSIAAGCPLDACHRSSHGTSSGSPRAESNLELGRLDEPLADPLEERTRLLGLAARADAPTARAALARLLSWHRVALRAAHGNPRAQTEALGRLREDEPWLLRLDRGGVAIEPLALAALDPELHRRQPAKTRAALESWLVQLEATREERGGLVPSLDSRTRTAIEPFLASLPLDLYARLYESWMIAEDERFDSAAIEALTLRDRRVLLRVAGARWRSRDRESAVHAASRLIALDPWDLEARILRFALTHPSEVGPDPENPSWPNYDRTTLLRGALDVQRGAVARGVGTSLRLALATRLMTSARPESAIALLADIRDTDADVEAVREFVRTWPDSARGIDALRRACSAAEREVVYFGLMRCRVEGATAAAPVREEPSAPTQPVGEAARAAAIRSRFEHALAQGDLAAAEAMLRREAAALPMVTRVGSWLELLDARAGVREESGEGSWSWDRVDRPPLDAATLARGVESVMSDPRLSDPPGNEADSESEPSPPPDGRANRYDLALRAPHRIDPREVAALSDSLPDEEAAFVRCHALLEAAERADRRTVRALAERLSSTRLRSVYPQIGRIAQARLRRDWRAAQRTFQTLARVMPDELGYAFPEPSGSRTEPPTTPRAATAPVCNAALEPLVRFDRPGISEADLEVAETLLNPRLVGAPRGSPVFRLEQWMRARTSNGSLLALRCQVGAAVLDGPWPDVTELAPVRASTGGHVLARRVADMCRAVPASTRDVDLLASWAHVLLVDPGATRGSLEAFVSSADVPEPSLALLHGRVRALVRLGRFAEGVTVLRRALDSPCAERVADDESLLRAMAPDLGDAALVHAYWYPDLDWPFRTRDNTLEAWRSVAIEDMRRGRLDRFTAVDIVRMDGGVEGYALARLRRRFPSSRALMLGALADASNEEELARVGSVACGSARACRALADDVLATSDGDPLDVAYAMAVYAASGETEVACRALAEALAAHPDDGQLLESQAVFCEVPEGGGAAAPP